MLGRDMSVSRCFTRGRRELWSSASIMVTPTWACSLCTCCAGILVILHLSLRSRESPYFIWCHIHWDSHVEVPNSQINTRLASALIVCPPGFNPGLDMSVLGRSVRGWSKFHHARCPRYTQKKIWSEKWRERACGANSNASKIVVFLTILVLYECQKLQLTDRSTYRFVDWLITANSTSIIIKHKKKTKPSDLLIFFNYGIGKIFRFSLVLLSPLWW
jgi:hypothetical protein